jgi:hypothetical protein
MNATVPSQFRCVWKREGLSVEGAAPTEPEQAYWAQSASLFANVRTGSSTDSPTAFAGRTTIDGDTIRWDHLITAETSGADDAGTFTFDNDTLIESGRIDVGGFTVSFREWWTKTSTSDAPVAYVSGERGIAIVGNDRAVIVIDGAGGGAGGGAAVAGWVLAASLDGWQVVIATVDGLAPPTPTPSGIECPRGWNWAQVP